VGVSDSTPASIDPLPLKQYTMPTFRKLGTLTDLTWGGSGTMSDATMPGAAMDNGNN
jgi:hypothetical protein